MGIDMKVGIFFACTAFVSSLPQYLNSPVTNSPYRELSFTNQDDDGKMLEFKTSSSSSEEKMSKQSSEGGCNDIPGCFFSKTKKSCVCINTSSQPGAKCWNPPCSNEQSSEGGCNDIPGCFFSKTKKSCVCINTSSQPGAKCWNPPCSNEQSSEGDNGP